MNKKTLFDANYLGRIALATVWALSLPAFAAPDEELLGKSKGYPIGTAANW